MLRILILCLALSYSTSTWATPITGELVGAGLWDYSESEAGESVYDFSPGLVLRSDGAFAGLFMVNPGDITVGPETTSGSWMIGAYRFVVDHISISGRGSWLDIVLRGWISDAPSLRTLTQNEPSKFALGISTNPDSYSFSTRVPEPGSIALLVIGLAGLVLMRRKKEYRT